MPNKKLDVTNPHALAVGKIVKKDQFPSQFMNWVRWNQEHTKYFQQCHRDGHLLNWFLCCERHYRYFCQLSIFQEYGRRMLPLSRNEVLSYEWFVEYANTMKVTLPTDFMPILFGRS